MFLNWKAAAPKSVTLLTFGLTVPPAASPRAERTMLPITEEPKVRFCPLVVDMVPVAVRHSEFALLPDMEAVGVPAATLMKANFDEPVATFTIKRSSVSLTVYLPHALTI